MPSWYFFDLSVPLSLSTLELTCRNSSPPSLHSPQTRVSPRDAIQGCPHPCSRDTVGNVRASRPALSLCTLRTQDNAAPYRQREAEGRQSERKVGVTMSTGYYIRNET